MDNVSILASIRALAVEEPVTWRVMDAGENVRISCTISGAVVAHDSVTAVRSTLTRKGVLVIGVALVASVRSQIQGTPRATRDTCLDDETVETDPPTIVPVGDSAEE